MNYEQSINYIHSIPKFSRVLGNDLLRVLLGRLGDPQKSLRFVHVGGTNGKGSTATMISEILKSAGYRTGLFTSPFLTRFNERIRIDGEPVGDESLAEIVSYVRKISEKHGAEVSEFAFITAAAMVYFAREKCDCVVLEVGLGGRLDATNVIEKPEAAVLTAIGLDHCQYLGGTVGEISMEKLGIVKCGSPLVLCPKQDAVVFENAKRVCAERGSELIIPDMPEKYDAAERSFFYKGEKYFLAMSGGFQALNAASAIEAANCLSKRGFEISGENIKTGLGRAMIPGRLDRYGNVIIDGAHNPQAVGALLNELKALGGPVRFLTAVMDDKDHDGITRLIAEFCKSRGASVTVTELDMPRCLAAESLAAEFEKRGVSAAVIKPPAAALRELKKSDGTICVCGSLYLAGEIHKIINKY